ncbi:ABC transporter substrate-binding protein [Aestuariirhabdus litorea]|uniref:ABC transporter substrate-binding protein n=1 Tax=Aestuariirhabdus litorea TaxID=2528527 RepID=A0A3P3VRK2_9GAMM|nr:ABC transporter substrate-binding protein [Aestuariirhabdus litorea]RRJ84316.1 ABC transporter substrate-binding protein [Aestuariirhabdus litorea]RWW97539.1 ABC transporter substrate-binding protein [Endozoicomonadaceae bacterium GTF-13]
MKRGVAILAGAVLAAGLSLGAQAKTLKMAYDADPVSMDPHEQLSGGTLQYSHMVFDPLVRWTKDLGMEPRLAEKWERIDDRTVRFFLRKGVKFHSGNSMTAADVKWTWDRLLSSPDFKAIFGPFEAMNVIDDYTVDLVTKEPFPLVLNAATYIFPMDSKFYSGNDEKGEPKATLKKHGDTFASRNESGTGPFKVTARQQGVRVDFERFADYWDKQSPGNVSNIVLTPIKEGPTRVAALLSGDVDFIAPVPPTDHDRIKQNEGTELVTMPGTRIITLQMNQERVEAFKDARVRQAIVYAINNEAIASKIMRGFATPAGQQGPKGYAGYDASLQPRYDLKKAKQLMKDAGYEKGFSITMMAPNNRYVNDAKIAEAAANMLSKINIKVDLKTMPKAQYWPEFDARAADMMMIGWHSDTEDSANFTEFLTACPNKETGWGQYNSGNYCNPEVDKLVQDSASETDPAKRAAMLQQVERTLYEEAAFVPLHWQNLAWGARKNVKLEAVVNVMDFPYLGDLVVE